MSSLLDRGLIPLTNPEMPAVPDDFRTWAAKQKEPVETTLLRCLYTPGGYTMPLTATAGGDKVTTELLAGHRWYERDTKKSLGPERCPLMIIGKGPSIGDMGPQRYFSGDMAQVMLEAMRAAKLSRGEVESIYVCGVMSTPPLVLGKSLSIWYKTQRILWLQQLLLVQPHLVLLQGAEAVKEVLGSKATLTSTEGTIITRRYNLACSANDEPIWHTVNFITSVSPAAVLHDRAMPGTDTKFKTQNEKRLHRSLVLFRQTYRGEERQQDAVAGVSYNVVTDSETLEKELQRMRDESVDRIVAWDAEWQGDQPKNADHYLRCIQFCWRDDYAVVISLTEPGGKPCFYGVNAKGEKCLETGRRDVARLCKQYMAGMRCAGHYFNADLKALTPFGLDLRDEYAAADSWEKADTQGGVAIELMAHAWDETQLFSLDDQIATHLDDFPIYSQELTKYKKQSVVDNEVAYRDAKAAPNQVLATFRKASRALEVAIRRYSPATARTASKLAKLADLRRKLAEAAAAVPAANAELAAATATYKRRKAEMKNGYGWMSEEALYPYAALDVVAELKLARFYLQALKADRFGNNCYLPYWTSHRASPAVLEMNMTGVFIDRDRLDALAVRFKAVRDKLERRIKELARWPELRLSSRFEFAELLFGDEYNGRFQQYGKYCRLRPVGAFTLRAEPLLTTGKYPETWDKVLERGTQRQVTPASSKQVLGEMYHTGERLKVRRFDDTAGQWVYRYEDHKELISLLRSFRTIDQAMKQVLAAPDTDAYEDELVDDDDDGNYEYSRGLASYICDDGMVRTTIRQTLETARWASVKPNMQNNSKSKEADYARVVEEVEAWDE